MLNRNVSGNCIGRNLWNAHGVEAVGFFFVCRHDLGFMEKDPAKTGTDNHPDPFRILGFEIQPTIIHGHFCRSQAEMNESVYSFCDFIRHVKQRIKVSHFSGHP